MRRFCRFWVIAAAWLSATAASAAIVFSPPRYVTGQANPIALDATALDADEIPDLILFTASFGVHVYLDNGTTWGPASDHGFTGSVMDVHAGDVDGDGDRDLLVSIASNVSGSGPPGVAILENDGQGAFPSRGFVPVYNPRSALVWQPVLGEPAHLLVVGAYSVTMDTEFHNLEPNGNGGYIDDVVPGYPGTFLWGTRPARGNFVAGGGHGIVPVVRRSDGSFGLELVNTFGVGLLTPAPVTLGKDLPQALAAGDIDGDGIHDLLLLLGGETGVAQLIRGRSNGAFAPGPLVVTEQSFASAIALGDLDHDGKLDIAVTGGPERVVRFLRGVGDDSFEPAGSVPARGSTRAITLADLDGDGRLDLAVASDSGTASTRVVGWRFNETVTLGAGDRVPSGPVLGASPNPVSGPLEITFEAPPGGGAFRVRVFDVAGREVARPFDGIAVPGRQRVSWAPRAGTPAAPGIYHVVAEGPTGQASVRVVRLK